MNFSPFRSVFFCIVCGVISAMYAAPLEYQTDIISVDDGFLAIGNNQIWFTSDGRDFNSKGNTRVTAPAHLVAHDHLLAIWSEYGIETFRRDHGGQLTSLDQSHISGTREIAAGPGGLLAIKDGNQFYAITFDGKIGELQSIEGTAELIGIAGGPKGWVIAGDKRRATPAQTNPAPALNSSPPSVDPPAQDEESDEEDTDKVLGHDEIPVDGGLWFSPDGQIWQEAQLPVPKRDTDAKIAWESFAHLYGGPRGWLAITVSLQALYSPDGRTWRHATVPQELTTDNTLRAVLATNDGFLVLNHHNSNLQIYRSPDAAKWTTETLPAKIPLSKLLFQNGQLLGWGQLDALLGWEVATLQDLAKPWRPDPVAATIDSLRASAGSDVVKLQFRPYSRGDKSQLRSLNRIRRSGDHFLFACDLGVVEGVHPDVPRPSLSWLRGDPVYDVAELPDGTIAQLRPTHLDITWRNLRSTTSLKVDDLANLNAIAILPNGIIAVGSRGTLVGWVNGKEKRWTAPAPMEFKAVAAGQGVAVVIANHSIPAEHRGVVIDGDLVTPLADLLPTGLPPVTDITFDGTAFTVVGEKGLELRSPDGRHWVAFEVEGKPDFRKVLGIGGTVYATTADNQILARQAAGRWAPVATGPDPTKFYWSGLVEDRGRLVAYTESGKMLRLSERPTAVPGERFLAATDVRQIAAAQAEVARLAARQAAEAKVLAEQEAQEKTLLAAVASLQSFDASLCSARNYESLGKPAADLVNALDALSDKRPANAVMQAALGFLRDKAGAEGFFAFQMALVEGRFAEGMKFARANLSKPQQTIIRELGGQTYSRVVGGAQKFADTSAWVAEIPSNRGPKTDDLLDLGKVYLAFAQGALGAAMDLEVAYEFGSGVPRHAGATAFWRKVSEQIPLGLKGPDPTPSQTLHAAATLGSAFAVAELADELERQNGVNPSNEIAALRRRAETGGLRIASSTRATILPATTAPISAMAPPHLEPPLIAHNPVGLAILDRSEYRLPLTSLGQEAQAFALVLSGTTEAINQGDPARFIAHLAGWLRVRRAAELMARKDPTLQLPAHDLQQHLLSFVEPAQKSEQYGTLLLLRLAMDRENWWKGKQIDEREKVRNDELGWLPWRAGALTRLPWLMLVASAGDLTNSGPAIPAWSPVLRHPSELFDGNFVPLLNVPAGRLASSDLNSLNTFYRRDPTAVLLTIHSPDAARSFETVALHTRAITQLTVAVNRNYDHDLAEHEKLLATELAAMDAKIAAADQKIREHPAVIETRKTKRVLVGTDRKSTYRTRSINENGPGTRQGDQVFSGFVDVPVYRDVEQIEQTPNYTDPLYLEKNRLVAERRRIEQKPGPRRIFADATEPAITRYDRWSTTSAVVVTMKERGVERTVRLKVPMTFELERSSGSSAPNVVLGSAGLRLMLAHPDTLGAAAVHRAVGAFLINERLTVSMGAARAHTEAALVGELLFGFEPDGGTVLQALRDLDRPASN